MFISPEVIDEAGLVSVRLTLEESTNMETDRTKLQDTLEGMYDLDGISINEDTLEELKTSHLKTKDTVNDQVIMDKTNCHTERLEEFDKRLEMSEARRAENNELIKEIGILWEERKRAMRKPDPPDFDEQEEWDQDQEDYEYLRYELEAEEEYT